MTQLEAHGLVLRAWTSADADTLRVLFDDPEIAYRTPVESPFDAEAADRYLARAESTGTHWAITTDGREPRGAIQLNPSSGGIAYLIGAAHRGQGLATRALRAVTEYAHTTLHLPRVILEIEPDNEASIAVGRSAGFRPTGTPHETVTDKGRTYELTTWEHTLN